MDRQSFWVLHDLIKNDPVFFNQGGSRPQRPTVYQLSVFLIRAGGESALKTADVTGVSEGSCYDYVDRVTKAIRRLRDRFMVWPVGQDAEEVKAVMAELGFPGCKGSGDGSLFAMWDKPLVDGFSYWTRKKFYGVFLHLFLVLSSKILR